MILKHAIKTPTANHTYNIILHTCNNLVWSVNITPNNLPVISNARGTARYTFFSRYMCCSLEPNTYTSHKMNVPFRIMKQFSEISGTTLLSWNAQSNSYRALKNRSQVCVQITAVPSPINETMDSFCWVFLCMSSFNVF